MVPVFMARFFGVMPRLLVAIYVGRTRANGDTALSCRSLPADKYDRSAIPANLPVIDWYGAFHFAKVPGDDAACRVCKLDREDQGGKFPAWLMNKTMPGFLEEEVVKVVDYTRKHHAELEAKFQAGPIGKLWHENSVVLK
jgi:hypothetical protein